MKYLESEYYSGRWYFGNQSYATIKNWFKIKDKAFRGIKHVTRRHRRSIAQRDLHRLYPKHKIMLGAIWIHYDSGWGAVDYPCFKDRVWKGCHRLVWNSRKKA